MAITATLIFARPDRLRYLMTQDGVISSPPVAADGLVTIPNDGGASADLLTDIQSAASPGVSGLPLLRLINARRDGFGVNPAGTALTQAQARALFLSSTAGVALVGNDNVLRARTRITPRAVGNFVAAPAIIEWAVDANVDGAGDPVIEVRSQVGVAATAWLDIHLRHTFDL